MNKILPKTLLNIPTNLQLPQILWHLRETSAKVIEHLYKTQQQLLIDRSVRNS